MSRQSWERVLEMLAAVGIERRPTRLCWRILVGMATFIPSEAGAFLLFTPGRRPPCSTRAFGVPNRAARECLSSIALGPSGLAPLTRGNEVNTISLSGRACPKPIAALLKPLGIRHSLAVILRDHTGRERALLTLHRARCAGFSSVELAVARRIQRLASNLLADLVLENDGSDLMRALPGPSGAARSLTAREAEIARLACRRLTAADMATMLGVSRRTVEQHLSSIYSKLEVPGRRALVAMFHGTVPVKRAPPGGGSKGY